MLLCWGIEVPQLRPQALLGLGHLLAFALALLTLAPLCQVSIAQPSVLACELREDGTQRLASRVQRLGPPGAHLRPLQVIGAQARLPQDTAEVLPDQCGHGLRWGHSAPCSARRHWPHLTRPRRK
jgi:hypothetical protein